MVLGATPKARPRPPANAAAQPGGFQEQAVEPIDGEELLDREIQQHLQASARGSEPAEPLPPAAAAGPSGLQESVTE
eukprot:1838937-Lingulodinium_polyedra.AAC.1